MGVKAIKQRYKIDYAVQKVDDNIHIGSAYINDIIVISPEGKLIKKYKDGNYNDGWNTNKDLKRYQEELLTDEKTGFLKELVQQADEFGELFPVYTCEKGRTVKTYCEEYDWPNLTIEGELMYENTFFKTRKEAYQYLLENTSLKYEWRIYCMDIEEIIFRLKKAVKNISISVYYYLFARSIERVTILFKS